ncbi:DUF6524 family protein [Azospirillum sp. SYSU D00513]|uniref:DUF6524 family protein n=1 Tax=Azospirillum sp. SYSU D00513 TaxID=2812561 RepID=UPI001A958FBB|nr:DUF6524 family protein [Azospirillum sp. SYSU D00513]
MRISRTTRGFGLSALLLRLSGTLFIMLSTYNPTGWSLYHWLWLEWPAEWLLQAPLALLYALAYILMLRATLRSLRLVGIALTTALMGTVAWLLIDAGMLALDDAADLVIILLYMLGGLLAAGMSWVPIWTSLTGQRSVDDLTG